MLTTITREDLKDKLDQGDDFVLVEALPEEQYRHAHLPGAVNLPPGQVEELASELLPDKDAEVVVYCSNPACPHSEEAARELAEMGYEDVKDYVEGKAGWMRAGLPVERDDEGSGDEEVEQSPWWRRVLGS